MQFLQLIFQLIFTLLQLLLLLVCPWCGVVEEVFDSRQKLRDVFAPPTVWATTWTSTTPHPLPLLFADDFEYGLGKWQLARGSWTHWQVTQDGWLEAHLSHSNTISELVPADEFWDQSWINYRLEFDYQFLTNTDRNWAWGYQDPANWYELHFYQDDYHLLRLKDASTVFYSSGSFGLNSQQTYHVVIEFNQGLIRVYIDGALLTERQDPTYENNGGKIVLKATTGAAFPTRVRFNNVRVYALDPAQGGNQDTQLNLTHFKQDDPVWRDDEYNHALSWRRWGDWVNLPPPRNQSPERTTIEHWGCALTSLAMVMNYHHLDKLPAGQPLNPQTLNLWLKQQADGYVGEGSVNWLAGTRLSRLIREKYSTPALDLPILEFSRSYSADLQPIINLINQQRPTILQIPGHFLVAHGYTQAQDDLLISDPAYTYHKFSEHDKELISAIDFQPSRTDLSYLMLVYDPRLSIELLNQDLEPLDQAFYSRDTIADQGYDHETCLLQHPDNGDSYCFAHNSAPIILYLPKPENGEYQLKVELSQGVDDLLIPWQIFAYDEQSEVKMIDRLSVLPEEEIVLNFDKTESLNSSIQTSLSYNFSEFSSLLLEKYNQQTIGWYLYWRLQEVSGWAMLTQDFQEQDRYAQLIFKLINEFSAEVTESAKTELLQVLLEG